MESYIKKLRQYIADNPIRFDYDCNHPALDSLYWHYTESHSLSNDKTKQADADLNAFGKTAIEGQWQGVQPGGNPVCGTRADRLPRRTSSGGIVDIGDYRGTRQRIKTETASYLVSIVPGVRRFIFLGLHLHCNLRSIFEMEHQPLISEYLNMVNHRIPEGLIKGKLQKIQLGDFEQKTAECIDLVQSPFFLLL